MIKKEDYLKAKETVEKYEEKLNICTVSGSSYNYSEKDLITNAKVSIKRGCLNKECFCTGRCNEIIGWRDKLHNEFQ